MDETVSTSQSPPAAPECGLCPMCREALKPDAKACVWCGFLLDEDLQRAQAAQFRKGLLGRRQQTRFHSGYWDKWAWLGLTLAVPVGLVAGQGGVITILSGAVLVGLLLVAFITLITGEFQRALCYLIALGVGTGVFLIILLAWGVAFH